ncbi:MAG: SRPBCC family protein [Acidimicrobiales bacterium]
MIVNSAFTVPAPGAEVWAYLLDVQRVARCLPGAELTEVVDAQNFKGRVKVKLGAMDLSFAGTVTVVEMDDAGGRAVMKASGREERGKGQAQATVTATVTEGDAGTDIRIVQDIQMSGPVAQFGRGLIEDVAGTLIQQFAACMKQELSRR